MNQPAVELRGLRKSYGSNEAVRGIDLRVERGEVFALLGPNGAGKTTTVEILEGHRSRSGGEVSVLGHDPGRNERALKERLGIVLQQTGVDEYLTVREVVRMVAGYYPRPRDVEEVLMLTGLGDQADRRVKKLSGGQKRRVDLAVALAGDPELLFLDEPTTGFDPSARRQAWETIRGLAALGKTVFLTTHFMDEAERLADTVHVIDAGRLIASGSPAELTAAGAENTIRFTARSGLDVAGLVNALPAGCVVTEESPGSYLVCGAVDPGLLATLTAWCAAHGVLAGTLAVERRTLEDVFLDLTGRGLRA